MDTPNKNNNIAIFDNLHLRKYYVEIDGQRYSRESFLVNYEQNNYFEQNKDLKMFLREFIGEELMTPFFSHPDRKTKYSTAIIDLRDQSDHITPEKIQRFHEYGADPENA